MLGAKPNATLYELPAASVMETFHNLGWHAEDLSEYGYGLFCFDRDGQHIELRTHDARLEEASRRYIGYFLVEIAGDEIHFVDEEHNRQLHREEDLNAERFVMIAHDLT
jgi:hypothetical protein